MSKLVGGALQPPHPASSNLQEVHGASSSSNDVPSAPPPAVIPELQDEQSHVEEDNELQQLGRGTISHGIS